MNKIPLPRSQIPCKEKPDPKYRKLSPPWTRKSNSYTDNDKEDFASFQNHRKAKFTNNMQPCNKQFQTTPTGTANTASTAKSRTTLRMNAGN
jgi:hypothetical protein